MFKLRRIHNSAVNLSFARDLESEERDVGSKHDEMCQVTRVTKVFISSSGCLTTKTPTPTLLMSFCFNTFESFCFVL